MITLLTNYSSIYNRRFKAWRMLAANAGLIDADYGVGTQDQPSSSLSIQKLHLSNGVRVSSLVYKFMKAGNAARAEKRWEDAVSFFQQAANSDPTLAHVWIQLGHAFNMVMQQASARKAYLRAAALNHASGEGFLHAGQWSERTGEIDLAIEYFKAAYLNNDTTEAGLDGLRKLRPSLAKFLEDAKDLSLSSSRKIRDLVWNCYGESPISDCQIEFVFDVSDLIAHYKNSKFPTGIQRVQIEVIESFANKNSSNMGIFFYIDGRDDFINLPLPLFLELARVSRVGSAQEWSVLIKIFFESVVFADTFSFQNDMIVVNLGTSWWIYNYFLKIRNLKKRYGIKFISYVHDLIPVVASEHCVTGVTVDYITWLAGAYEHSDGFVTNSASTTSDLLFSMRFMGRNLSDDRVKTVPLNASFSNQVVNSGIYRSQTSLAKWGLKKRKFVLFVSTVESRKNHELAFLAWERLCEMRGADNVPELVCVGKDGWLNHKAHSVIERNPMLSDKISFITRVDDDELKALYHASLFTLYPSHYEGWGLPITESLSFGRIPVYADNSSLPEAGDGFGVIFESGNILQLCNKINDLLEDQNYHSSLEKNILDNYKPMSWHLIAEKIEEFSKKVECNQQFPSMSSLILGEYIPLALLRTNVVWKGIGSGEVYRVGENWLWPGKGCCRIKPGTAHLRLGVLPCELCRVFVHMVGLDSQLCNYVIRSADNIVASGAIDAKSMLWSVFDVVVEDGYLSISIESDESEIVEMNHGGTTKLYSQGLGIMGVAVSDARNPNDRLDFLSAVTNHDLSPVTRYRQQE